MKKIVAIALLVASFCVVGCDSKPAAAPAKPSGAANPSTPAGK